VIAAAPTARVRRRPLARLGSRVARIARLPVALVVLAGIGATPPAAFVASPTAIAATPDLTLVTDARYLVQPEKRRVHVIVDVTATNNHPDTVTATYYFDRGYLAVLPGTTGYRVAPLGSTTTSSPSTAKPSVSIASTAPGYTLLSIAFGRRLLSGQSMRLRLQFDLPDPGTPATRQIRIGSTPVAFPVWAFATNDTAGSTVTVTFPAGYRVTVLAGSMPPPTTAANGSVVLTAGPLARPLAFYAFLSADRPASLVPSRVATTIGGTRVSITLRAWPDDPAWAKRTGSIFVRGLPRLASAIGLPYPGTDLAVEETSSRATGGYAGLYDASSATIRVAYDARDDVALHEAAHAWFNGRLLSERWANEAFASAYAAQVAAPLGIVATPTKLTAKLLAERIPLNAWSAVGQEPTTAEDYAYAASAQLADEIVSRAGLAALRDVWSSAAAGRAAYQPTQGTGRVELQQDGVGPPDWRTLLDLLEERTGRSYADLWRTWVVRPGEASLLDDRAAARAAYADAVARAGSWELSPLVRRPMDAWQFGDARRLIGQADAAIEEWSRVGAAAAAAGLTPSDAAQRAFEGSGGPAAASHEMDAELGAIGVIRDATTTAAGIDAGRGGILARIGLLGETPDAVLAQARRSYEAGDLTSASSDAAAARAMWNGAEEQGRRRLAIALFAVVGLGGLLALAAGRLRRRAAGLGSRRAVVGPGEPYATLAGEPPDEDGRVETGDAEVTTTRRADPARGRSRER
jgi:hypothetical protein